MKYSRPRHVREALIDVVALDGHGRVWLQQAKPNGSDWTLLRRRTASADPIGVAHEELMRLGFMVHEVMVLRESAAFWTAEAHEQRMAHLLLVAEVAVGDRAPEMVEFYVQAFAYGEALKLRQRYGDDLRQLFDPMVDVMVRRLVLARG